MLHYIRLTKLMTQTDLSVFTSFEVTAIDEKADHSDDTDHHADHDERQFIRQPAGHDEQPA